MREGEAAAGPELCSGPENYGRSPMRHARCDNAEVCGQGATMKLDDSREPMKVTAGAVAAVVMTAMLFVILLAVLIAPRAP